MHPWPDFFIVGAPRCGTTSLYHYLRPIDGIFLPAFKEPMFFNCRFRPEERFATEGAYLDLFRQARQDQRIGEASATYLHDSGSAERIHQANPNAKIVAILRNPVDRAYSHYLLQRRYGLERRTFYEAIRTPGTASADGFNVYVDFGRYSAAVAQYQALFGAANVLVERFDDFIASPTQMVQRVLDLLGISALDLEINPEPHLEFREPKNIRLRAALRAVVNARLPGGITLRTSLFPLLFGDAGLSLDERLFSKGGKKPPMDPGDRAFLRDTYAADLDALGGVLGRDFRGWLENRTGAPPSRAKA